MRVSPDANMHALLAVAAAVVVPLIVGERHCKHTPLIMQELAQRVSPIANL
jgi:hypothetical protein